MMGWIIARHRNHPNGDLITRHKDEPKILQQFMRDFMVHGQTTEILGYVDNWTDSWNYVTRKQKAKDKSYG